MKKQRNKTVECQDGFFMSVQAFAGAYCHPKNDVGPYTEVEVGYPSHPEALLMEYAEDPSRPTDTVYAWVPREIVLLVIAKHGGMTGGDLPYGISNLWEMGANHESI